MFVIRKATVNDCADLSRLIKALAEYTGNTTGLARLDENDLQRDGFEKTPFFHSAVAEVEKDGRKEVVGYVLYYYTYSTWTGKAIYMEDIYVSPAFRGQGIGTALWRHVAQVGLKMGCVRLHFCVINWNAPSIEFYEKRGAVNITKEEGWDMYRLCHDELVKLAEM